MHRLLTSLCLLLLVTLTACSDSTDNIEVRPQPLVARISEAGLRREYAEFRSEQVSNITYDLKLSLSDVSEDFSGFATIQFDLAEGNRSPVTLDFFTGSVLYVNVNGMPAEYDYDRWYIEFAPELFSPGTNYIQISYSAPYSHDGAGLHHFTDPENDEIYLYTQFEPYDANRMFPLFDQPDLKATWSLEVIVPENWRVISNTRESRVEQLPGEKHWFFPESPRISSYLFALHAGPWAMWESQAGTIPLRLFARNSIAPYVAADDWFTYTQQNFAFFENWFDISYPFGKYDQLIVPDFNFGAMENVGAVTFSERFISRGEYSRAQKRSIASTIAHEMAHMWFGDLVTMKWWNGLWLNESFASYMSYLSLSQATEFTEAWDGFYTGMKLNAYSNDRLVTTHPVEQPVASSADAFTIVDGITYGKGGAILRQLHYRLGEDTFQQGIRRYLKDYSWQNTSLDDFVAALADASGLDLESWQQEWLYTTGANTLAVDFTCNEAQMIESFYLIQETPDLEQASQILRSQQTGIAFYRYTDEQMVPYFNTAVMYSGASTEVPEAIGQPCPELVFPNEGDYAYARIRLDDISAETLRTRINNIADTTTRLMLWQALWDDVTAGKAPATRFIAFAIDALPGENDSLILNQVSRYIAQAGSFLEQTDAELYAEDLQNLEDFFWLSLTEAAPASDEQRLWFSRATSASRSDEALARLYALFSADQSMAGLTMDQDRRWSILNVLNRRAWGDYAALLEAELDRDSSDFGYNRYLSAVAVRPDPNIKAEWVEIISSQPEAYKPATMRAVMSSLFPPEQLSYLQQHQEILIAAIAGLIDRDDHVYLNDYMSRLGFATCDAASATLLTNAINNYEGSNLYVDQGLLVERQRNQECMQMVEGLTIIEPEATAP